MKKAKEIFPHMSIQFFSLLGGDSDTKKQKPRLLADTRSHTSNTSNVVQHFFHVLHHLSLPLRLRSTFHKLLNMVANQSNMVWWKPQLYRFEMVPNSSLLFLSSERHHLKGEIRVWKSRLAPIIEIETMVGGKYDPKFIFIFQKWF